MRDDDQAVPLPPASSGAIGFESEALEAAVPASGFASWKLQVKTRDAAKQKIKFTITIDASGEGAEEAPEWGIRILDSTGAVMFDGNASHSTSELSFNMEGTKPKDLKVEAHAPVGARYGDKVKVTVKGCLAETPNECAVAEFQAHARQSILALKTSIGHERTVADSVGSKAKAGKTGIVAILAPTNLRGYVLIEGMNTDHLKESVKGIRRARGLVDGETSFSEIDHFLAPKPLVSGIMEGDVVELVAGPFKGEKARVQQIDEQKEEITVELFEAMVPIPVTVRGDHVRVLEKER